MMKILLVTYWWLTSMGGIRTYMNQLADRLRTHGHEVDLMGTDLGTNSVYVAGQNRRFSKDSVLPLIRQNLAGAPLPQLHGCPQAMAIESDRYAFEMGAAALGVNHYDLIHAQDPIAALSIRRILRSPIPLLVSFHGSLAREGYHDSRSFHPELTWTEFRSGTYGKHYASLEYLGAEASDLILVSSGWIKGLIVESGIPAAKIRQVPYGIDIPAFLAQSSAEFPKAKNPDRKLIMYTGRLEYVKGVQVLIEALGLLSRTRSDWKCWIIGDGGMLTQLQNRCVELGIDREVEFLGVIDNIPSALKKADIYVQPSLQDTQPFSLTEAQLAGVASIAANTTGMPEMIQEGVTGLLFAPEDPASLCAQLSRLLSNPGERSTLGYHASQWVFRNRTLAQMYQGTWRVYQELTGG
ncbi:glycosyltransferase family 1 protein [Paenibacillus zeisoli]|uniref:Glycosyltransferase family 1 protein n=1 Tax=Paenibacillus zeisoli TaxID=2496267 RepID=A0A3S1JM47_9BACL|nr:glycosyltransferase family 4 protein [Paenibacillus zeisoli]RUT29164.1 glycosyltransferase family 1 protein [Paenibacillus zeisoli]